MKHNFQRCILTIGVAGALAVLAACGGSSGGGGSGSGDPQNLGPSASASSVSMVTKAETTSDASRFLAQSTFGPTMADIDRVMTANFDGWLDQEFAKPHAPVHLTYWQERLAATPTGATQDWLFQSFWKSALAGDDALRQRVAFALSQIFVVSLLDMNVTQYPRGVASYYDMLGWHAFGNFRQLLEGVALHPMMGLYLSHLRNRGEAERVPDENFAREVMQLFTIGLYELNPDGIPKNGADGQPIESYSNDDVTGIAKIFTGWSWAGPDKSESRFNGSTRDPNRDITPMQSYPQFHATTEKVFLGGTCPGGVMPEGSLGCALDRLFNHPNAGPFFARQMIQRLVVSNPGPAYVARVAAAFANNGSGVRGDMKAILRAILLDPEARIAPAVSDLVYGKPREPLLRMTALLRATNARSTSGQYRIGNTDNPGTSLGQTAMRSPSVFNFWRPGYTPPNSELAAGSLVAPELQASNETSVAGYLNAMQSTVQSGIGNDNPRDVQPDFSELTAVAGDADALLARIELLLTSGKYKPETRTRIRDVVSSISIPMFNETNAATARRNRVMVALYLTIASPEFLVQK